MHVSVAFFAHDRKVIEGGASPIGMPVDVVAVQWAVDHFATLETNAVLYFEAFPDLCSGEQPTAVSVSGGNRAAATVGLGYFAARNRSFSNCSTIAVAGAVDAVPAVVSEIADEGTGDLDRFTRRRNVACDAAWDIPKC